MLARLPSGAELERAPTAGGGGLTAPDLADEGQPQRAPLEKGEAGIVALEGENGPDSISSGDMSSACSHTPSSWTPLREGAFLAGGEGLAR